MAFSCHVSSMEIGAHVVCFPTPVQSHISSMLKLAKLLHHRGCHVTFVNTEFNHRRLLEARGPSFLTDLPTGFRFMAIPDGLPPSKANATQDMVLLCESCRGHMAGPFEALVRELNERAMAEAANLGSDFPAVSCIVADGFMTFSACPAGEKFDIPVVNLWTIPACALMASIHIPTLKEKGLITPQNEESCDLETSIDCIPGMKNMRLHDMPRFSKAMDPQDSLLNFTAETTARFDRAAATIIHTFEELEPNVLKSLSDMFSGPAYAIGPFHLLVDGNIPENGNNNRIKNVGGNLWKEDTRCLWWLDSQKPGSVLYINFGSIAFLTSAQLAEFAMGIASSKHPFLWVIRPDLVNGDAAILPPEFGEETKDRSFICEWCPQEKVLNHGSVGGFLTHCGWNSTIESLSTGVPMLCWPCFSDQMTICRYLCTEWAVGLEIGTNVTRSEVARLVKELMEGEAGRKMKEKAMEWKRLAIEARAPTGSSTVNLDKLIREIVPK